MFPDVYLQALADAYALEAFKARRKADADASAFFAGLDWSDAQIASYQSVVAGIERRLERVLRFRKRTA